ncbi:FecR family protein [Sphingobacterium sp.]|uniref:FecR family protein n=1 Tax=Sphingobacterium sp. TaxID=341027 RepID=UPI0028A6BC1E|nr:FecR family protein [Sphingobacterium sp.]
MNQKEKLTAILIFKYIQGICTVRDIRKLNNWLEENMENKDFFRDAVNTVQLKEDLDLLNSFDAEKSWNKRQRKKKTKIFIWSIAASLTLFALSFLLLYSSSWLYNEETIQLSQNERKVDSAYKDKYPAKVGAQLILSNGEKILLDKPLQVKHSGEILNSDQKIITTVNQPTKNEKIKWLEIQVPAAQYYSIVLPDSSMVWLNSNSTIKFPSRFDQQIRMINLSGEAYFQIKHSPKQPFIVKTADAEIKVLGTSFNVNNYNNSLIASLEEGKIEIRSKSDFKELKPLQKVELIANRLIVSESDLQKELAWKNNKFIFSKDNLKDILFQIENWYGIKTNYQSIQNNDETFTGTIDRDVKLSKILDILNSTSKYNFLIIDNQLISTLKH